MLHKIAAKKIGIASSIIAGLVLFLSASAHAQTVAQPQFIVNWKASGSYVPSFYQGKALPTFGSKITASLMLISQDRPIDLSGETIYWYLNNVLIGGGTGVQKITFSPLGTPPNFSTLKVQLPQYAGGFLSHVVQIPMTRPKAVIYAPYPNGIVTLSPVTVKALPYFFNAPSANSLSFTWSVNSQTGSNAEIPDQAQINLPAGTPAGTNLLVALSVKNSGDSTIGNASVNLTYQKSL